MSLIEKFRDFFKNLNLLFKFQFALFIVSVTTLSVMGLYGYFQGQKLLKEKAFQLLISHTESKKNAIEEYFVQLSNQIRTLSRNPSTIYAIQDFDSTYRRHSIYPAADQAEVINRYYELDFLKPLNYNKVVLDEEEDRTLVPDNPRTRALQYKYIANNPKPQGYKHLNNPIKNREAYDDIHDLYHSSFLSYREGFQLDDVMLINQRGEIIYSVSKKVDFATSLQDGPFRNSNLANIFNIAIKGNDPDFVFFQDYKFYEPSLNKPSCFLAKTIFSDDPRLTNKKIGVLVFQVSNKVLTNLVNSNQNWQKDGLGTTGETALIGPDFLLRNDTRLFLQDPLLYHQNLLAYKADSIEAEKIRRLETTILLRKSKSQAVIDALNGKNGSKTGQDFLNSEILDVYMPVNILDTQWAILTEINSDEVFQAITDLRNQLLIVSVILFIGVTLIGFYLAKSLSDPMRNIQREVTLLSEGKFPKLTSKIYKDELGKIDEAMNTLIISMQNVAEFAENIGEGNFDYRFEPQGENDVLGNALIRMRDNLKEVSEEENQRNWINTGTALFGDILRDNSDDSIRLSENLTAELVKYLKANQGAIFIWNEGREILEVTSAYAYDKYKYLDKGIQPGEGLVGQAFLERATIYLEDIPEDYSDISSGLGKASPSSILIVPIKANQQIQGVLELASFEKLKDYEIAFVESISEDIATTLAAIKVNAETMRLLEESRQVTEQLKRQEEEMRRSFEELMKSQEEVRERQQHIDSLLKDEVTLDHFKKLGEESETVELEISEPSIKERVKAVVFRQKRLLDKAVQKNQTEADKLKEKVDKIDTNGTETED